MIAQPNGVANRFSIWISTGVPFEFNQTVIRFEFDPHNTSTKLPSIQTKDCNPRSANSQHRFQELLDRPADTCIFNLVEALDNKSCNSWEHMLPTSSCLFPSPAEVLTLSDFESGMYSHADRPLHSLLPMVRLLTPLSYVSYQYISQSWIAFRLIA